MKFTLDSRTDVNLIRGYGPGEVRIGERVQRSPCVITSRSLILDWPARDVATLCAQDLEVIFALKPDVVLLGTGARQTLPAAGIRQEFLRRAIGLEVMDLGAACRTYNILVQEDRSVAAALFPAY
ncbi:MAG TPA: MTH938/NDUFAF3 family protein [Steroidobacteraceae bacterium]|nr:MTH938/NDUFAF3 family protein [Steroidobacteraceae bacterium]